MDLHWIALFTFVVVTLETVNAQRRPGQPTERDREIRRNQQIDCKQYAYIDTVRVCLTGQPCMRPKCNVTNGVCTYRRNACNVCEERWTVNGEEVQCDKDRGLFAECPNNEPADFTCQACKDINCPNEFYLHKLCRNYACNGLCRAEFEVNGRWKRCKGELYLKRPLISSMRDRVASMGADLPFNSAAASVLNMDSPFAAAAAGRGPPPPIAAGFEISRQAGPGDVAGESSICPPGVRERTRAQCGDICADASCAGYPNATCVVNRCGRCSTEFYVGSERVNCLTKQCAPGVRRNPTCTSCRSSYCHRYPQAVCIMNNCGKCKAEYYVNGHEVSCNELNLIDSCPNNGKRHMCDMNLCNSYSCPQNSSIKCWIDNCDGCKRMFSVKNSNERYTCPAWWTHYGRNSSRPATPEEIAAAEARHNEIFGTSSNVLTQRGNRPNVAPSDVGGLNVFAERSGTGRNNNRGPPTNRERSFGRTQSRVNDVNQRDRRPLTRLNGVRRVEPSVTNERNENRLPTQQSRNNQRVQEPRNDFFVPAPPNVPRDLGAGFDTGADNVGLLDLLMPNDMFGDPGLQEPTFNLAPPPRQQPPPLEPFTPPINPAQVPSEQIPPFEQVPPPFESQPPFEQVAPPLESQPPFEQVAPNMELQPPFEQVAPPVESQPPFVAANERPTTTQDFLGGDFFNGDIFGATTTEPPLRQDAAPTAIDALIAQLERAISLDIPNFSQGNLFEPQQRSSPSERQPSQQRQSTQRQQTGPQRQLERATRRRNQAQESGWQQPSRVQEPVAQPGLRPTPRRRNLNRNVPHKVENAEKTKSKEEARKTQVNKVSQVNPNSKRNVAAKQQETVKLVSAATVEKPGEKQSVTILKTETKPVGKSTKKVPSKPKTVKKLVKITRTERGPVKKVVTTTRSESFSVGKGKGKGKEPRAMKKVAKKTPNEPKLARTKLVNKVVKKPKPVKKVDRKTKTDSRKAKKDKKASKQDTSNNVQKDQTFSFLNFPLLSLLNAQKPLTKDTVGGGVTIPLKRLREAGVGNLRL